MIKYFYVLAFALAAISLTAAHSNSLGAPAPAPADYPHMVLSTVKQTNLKASACANNAQDALKQSGFTRTGSGKPGNGLFGIQGSYVAGINWDSERHLYYYFVAGPDKSTAEDYAKTLREKVHTLMEN